MSDQRQWVICGGEGFRDSFDRAMKREFMLMLLKASKFNEEEKARIKEMIESDDQSNYNLASVILINSQDGSTFQS